MIEMRHIFVTIVAKVIVLAPIFFGDYHSGKDGLANTHPLALNQAAKLNWLMQISWQKIQRVIHFIRRGIFFTEIHGFHIIDQLLLQRRRL